MQMACVAGKELQPIIAQYLSGRHLLTPEEMTIEGGAIREQRRETGIDVVQGNCPKRRANAGENIDLR